MPTGVPLPVHKYTYIRRQSSQYAHSHHDDDMSHQDPDTPEQIARRVYKFDAKSGDNGKQPAHPSLIGLPPLTKRPFDPRDPSSVTFAFPPAPPHAHKEYGRGTNETGHVAPPKGPDRPYCGPRFGHTKCDCKAKDEPFLYCNEANGWCGQSEGHKTAQRSSKYDCSWIEELNTELGPPNFKVSDAAQVIPAFGAVFGVALLFFCGTRIALKRKGRPSLRAERIENGPRAGTAVGDVESARAHGTSARGMSM